MNKVMAAPRKTTIKQDLKDIGRMAVGFAKDLSGRGGRVRKQVIDDATDEAQTGRKR